MRGRVVIDPDELREVSSRLRDAAEELAWTGRRLATSPVPDMPTGVAGVVGEAIYRVNAELQDLAVELEDEARLLNARATWAELGGGAGLGWLLPALGRFPQVGSLLGGPGHLITPLTEIDPAGVEGWAEELVDGSPTGADEVTQRVEVRVETLPNVETLPGHPLGEFTLIDADNLDLLEPLRAPAEAGASVQGVFQIGLSTLSLDPVAAGIAGCILVGAGFDTDDAPSHEPPQANG